MMTNPPPRPIPRLPRVKLPIPSSLGAGSIIDVELALTNEGEGRNIWTENFPVTKEHNACFKRTVAAAQRLAGKYFEKDLTLRTLVPQSITGYSWELLLTLGMASLLTGIPLRMGLTGSGIMDKEGNIESVTGIPNKLRAAKEAGYSLFLVSADQSINEKVEGIQVIPVKNIQEAWEIATVKVMENEQTWRSLITPLVSAFFKLDDEKVDSINTPALGSMFMSAACFQKAEDSSSPQNDRVIYRRLSDLYSVNAKYHLAVPKSQ